MQPPPILYEVAQQYLIEVDLGVLVVTKLEVSAIGEIRPGTVFLGFGVFMLGGHVPLQTRTLPAFRNFFGVVARITAEPPQQ